MIRLRAHPPPGPTTCVCDPRDIRVAPAYFHPRRHAFDYVLVRKNDEEKEELSPARLNYLPVRQVGTRKIIRKLFYFYWSRDRFKSTSYVINEYDKKKIKFRSY
jgi:hypothetical protein